MWKRALTRSACRTLRRRPACRRARSTIISRARRRSASRSSTRYGADQARREILADPSIPPLQRLRRHFERINALFVDSQFERGCILGGFSAELANQSPTIRESLRNLYAQWTKDIETAIAEAQEQGKIANKTKAADIAAFLLDSYEGALLRARVERSRKPFDRFMKFAFTQILV